MFAGVKSRGSRVESRKADGGHSSFVIRHSSFRAAITLTEVLISMGILTFGLLGVAAMFPVGGFYLQKGDIADRGSAIAQSVMSDVVANGMLDPEKWYTLVTAVQSPAPRPALRADGALNSFTRPLVAALNEESARTIAEGLSPAARENALSKRFGTAFVLDPMGVASFVLYNTNAANKIGASVPATAHGASVSVSDYGGYTGATWNQWKSWWDSIPGSEETWPIRRVTFLKPDTNPAARIPMDMALAGARFSSHDDLAMDVPDTGDGPSIQRWEAIDTDGDGQPDMPLARQWRGDYSWFVTVAPNTSDAHKELANHGGGHEYNVSVVVFHKRAIDRINPEDVAPAEKVGVSRANSLQLMEQERAVRAQVVSTGLNGGELLLTAYDGKGGTPNDGPEGSPYSGLHTGQWIMLCGPHPNSTALAPRFVLNWYRVLSIEGKDTALNSYGQPSANPTNEPERRLVAVRGPQWPWEPGYGLSNWLCAGIFPGAVAVHNKTIRMEGNSPWSVD